jgi:hypothetical protein
MIEMFDEIMIVIAKETKAGIATVNATTTSADATRKEMMTETSVIRVEGTNCHAETTIRRG